MRKVKPLIKHEFVAYVAKVGNHTPCIVPDSEHCIAETLLAAGFVKMKIKATEIRVKKDGSK